MPNRSKEQIEEISEANIAASEPVVEQPEEIQEAPEAVEDDGMGELPADPVLVAPEDVPTEPALEEIQEEAPAEDAPAAQETGRARRATRHDSAPGRQILPDEVLGENGEGLDRASRRAQRRLYQPGEDVYTIDSDDAGRQANPARESMLQLAQSMRTMTPMQGKLDSISRLNGGNIQVGVVFMEGGYRVLIPLTHLFVIDPATARGGNIDEAYHYYGMLRIGATVSFVVRSIQEQSKTAYASRLMAMEYYANRNFRELQTRTGQPRITPGEVVEATITYVTKTGIGVDVFGVETFIRSGELFWTRVYDVKNEGIFVVGNKIKVRILSYQDEDFTINGHTFHLLDLRVSHRQTTEDPNEAYYDSFNIGDIVRATITQITDKGYFVSLADKRDAFCPFLVNREIRILPMGTVVTVKILQKFDDGKRIFGDIRQIAEYPKQ